MIRSHTVHCLHSNGRLRPLAHDDPRSPVGGATAPAARLLEGRRFLVTGGARGLGAAIVDTLADHGAEGAVIDLRAPEHSRAGWAFASADVSDENAMRSATRALMAEHG